MESNTINQYQDCIKVSEKVSWSINDLVPDSYQVDYQKIAMPDQLTLLNKLDFLTPDLYVKLNHVRCASYVNLFAFVEEYISAQVIQATSNYLFDDNVRVRALLRFSEEEVKHQTMFLKYLDIFHSGFSRDYKCEFLGGASDVASIILSNSEAGVMFVTLHLELITQQHYQESIKNNSKIDPKFVNVLKNHWIEEVQHAKIDALELEDYVKDFTEEELLATFDEYFGILDAFIDLLKVQVQMDFDSFMRISNNMKLDQSQKDLFKRTQEFSYIYNFVIYGLENKIFRKYCNRMSPLLVPKLDQKRKEILEAYSI